MSKVGRKGKRDPGEAHAADRITQHVRQNGRIGIARRKIRVEARVLPVGQLESIHVDEGEGVGGEGGMGDAGHDVGLNVGEDVREGLAGLGRLFREAVPEVASNPLAHQLTKSTIDQSK